MSKQSLKPLFSNSFFGDISGMSLAYGLPQQVHEETFMDKTLSFVLIFLFMSACATVKDKNDFQTTNSQALAVPTPETPVAEAASSSTDSTQSSQVASAPSNVQSKQEIKLLQSQLKAAGFDPGPLDGVLGAKTTSALRRLQLGCANLKDLLENPAFGTFQQSAGMQTAQQSVVDRILSADEIRLIQVRLKDAGFDVGAIDGVMGSRTRSALLRFQSGCIIVKDLPPYLNSEPQTAERLSSPASTAEKPTRSALAKSSPAVASMKDEANKVNVAPEKSPSKEKIRLLQTQLKAAGFDPGPFDGLLGPKTQSALQQYRAFQSNSKPLSGIGLKY
jgi:peptidoglycan hydrolase-like protein with peptidoglycan-binding domain